MAHWLAQLETLGGVAAGMALAGLIGIERELANKPAGFRTHTLVAGAAALAVGVGINLVPPGDVGSATRVIQGIVTGVGFLGAGTIFKHSSSDHVEGLTTAASVLLVTCIGVAAGAQQYIAAAGTTLLALIVLRGMRAAESLFGSPKNKKSDK